MNFRTLFVLLIGWHFAGHFIGLMAGTPWFDFVIGPPWCGLLGCTSFHDPLSYNLFWSGYIAITGVVGFFSMRTAT